jgi:hypothetical protein
MVVVTSTVVQTTVVTVVHTTSISRLLRSTGAAELMAAKRALASARGLKMGAIARV